MHASTFELLSLRDGEPAAARIADHVASCSQCTAEMARLVTVRERLSRLPQAVPLDSKADELWIGVRNSLSSKPPASFANRYLAIAAVAVWAVVGMVWFVVADRDPLPAPESVQSGPPSLESLVVQSQELEGVLLELPRRPHVEQAATAATLDALEGRIQWLDYALSSSAAGGESRDQVAMLWEERVELLDSLVTLRYAQASRMSF